MKLLCFSANNLKGKLGKPSYLEERLTKPIGLAVDESAYTVTFDWDEEIDIPGALIVKNEHHSEFFLKNLTLEDVPHHGKLHFVCNSWVYPTHQYEKDRIFFTNKVIISICKIQMQEKENIYTSFILK